MLIAITGATGFIGSRVAAELTGAGHRVVPIGRRAGAEGVRWDPAAGRIDAARLEGLDAVIHLAGESLNGRWTAARKRRIVESRVRGTALLAQALAGLRRRALAPAWSQFGSIIFGLGEHYFNFQGLRYYKSKFDPIWQPK